MPVMDGITATRAIITKYKQDAPVIVALTANTYADDKQACLEVGMQDFIAKPFQIDEIIKVLKAFH
ncbi:MAG: response regulator [Glaciecola sp.]